MLHQEKPPNFQGLAAFFSLKTAEHLPCQCVACPDFNRSMLILFRVFFP